MPTLGEIMRTQKAGETRPFDNSKSHISNIMCCLSTVHNVIGTQK